MKNAASHYGAQMKNATLDYEGRKFKWKTGFGYGHCWENDKELAFTDRNGKVDLVIPKKKIKRKTD